MANVKEPPNAAEKFVMLQSQAAGVGQGKSFFPHRTMLKLLKNEQRRSDAFIANYTREADAAERRYEWERTHYEDLDRLLTDNLFGHLDKQHIDAVDNLSKREKNRIKKRINLRTGRDLNTGDELENERFAANRRTNGEHKLMQKFRPAAGKWRRYIKQLTKLVEDFLIEFDKEIATIVKAQA